MSAGPKLARAAAAPSVALVGVSTVAAAAPVPDVARMPACPRTGDLRPAPLP